jgi:hypothetical protein
MISLDLKMISAVRKLVSCVFIVACALLAGDVVAQTPSDQDSICGGFVRPRRDAFLIQTFPSPAKAGEPFTVQFYNHAEKEISLRVVDVLDRTILQLQERATTPAGLHKFLKDQSRDLATGMYFVRLTTYTPTGAIEQVQDSRLVILH